MRGNPPSLFFGIERTNTPHVGFCYFTHSGQRVEVFGIHGSTIASSLGCSFGQMQEAIDAYIQENGQLRVFYSLSELCALVTCRKGRAFGLSRKGKKRGIVRLNQAGCHIHTFNLDNSPEIHIIQNRKFLTFEQAVNHYKAEGWEIQRFPSFAELVKWME